jgi:rhodanese-related sulfurtransferase
MKIGQYQLENLLRQRIPFLYLDLRKPDVRASEAVGHFLLSASVAVEPDKVLDYVLSLGLAISHPIVMICETGLKSMDAALELEKNSFVNVYVIEGGTKSLTF